MSEELAFLRAIYKNPRDRTALAVYADWVAERSEAGGEERAQWLRGNLIPFSPDNMDAFTLARRAHPDDDALYFSFADWYGENTDRQRGDFIRDQVIYSRFHQNNPSDNSRDNAELFTRMANAVHHNSPTWLNHLHPDVRPFMRFNRGFADEVIIDDGIENPYSMLSHLSSHHIPKLTIETNGDVNYILTRIHDHPVYKRFKEIDLFGTPADQVTLRLLPKDITDLDIGGTDITGPNLRRLQSFKNLSSLRIYEIPLDKENIPNIPKTVTALYVSHIDGDMLKAITYHLPDLKELSITNAQVSNIDMLHLRNTLRVFRLRDARLVTDAGLANMNSTLNQLYLANTGITADGPLKYIEKGNFPDLIAGTNIVTTRTNFLSLERVEKARAKGIEKISGRLNRKPKQKWLDMIGEEAAGAEFSPPNKSNKWER